MNTTELRALLATATPGPYTVEVTVDNDVRVMARDAEDPGFPWHFCTVEWNCAEVEPHQNAAAIVALHNAAPALLDAADRLARIEAVLGGAAVDAVANAVAATILAQDSMADGVCLPASLKLEWLDQGETDFSPVARAALAAIRAMLA